jgi:mycofactocin system glycosyltransferase
MDLGRHEAPVIPGSAVSFVPTAALVVRRSALAAGFDESLRFGEDVDLVWRLHDAGQRIRYEPSATVLHDEPRELRRILARRFRYGTAAAPLSARHPGRLAPAVLHLRPALVLAALIAGRPRAAAALALPQCALLARRAARLGLPASVGLRWFGEATAHSLLGGARAATMFGWPLALAAAVRKRRRAALALLALPALVQWRARRPDLDPVRFTALALVDDAAYGAGVVRGCLAERTLRPLLPSIR